MAFIRAVVKALSVPTPWYLRPIEPDPEPEPAPNRFVCGVPECSDGYVLMADTRYTIVACDTHEANTSHDTVEREVKEQRIIRVQDGWRQHGTRHTPK
jgi:hypothetical protein